MKSYPDCVAARRSFFEQHGYLLPVPILDPAEVQRAQAMFERLYHEHRRAGRPGRICNRHHDDAEVWYFATHPRVLRVARECFGPDLVLLSGGFFHKEPDGSGAYVDWHQDTMYWGMRPPKALTVWLAIYDATVENGCLRLVPDSHRGLLPHTTARAAGNLLGQNQAIDPCHFDVSTVVDCVLAAGQASVHHGELVHGSNPNNGTLMRCGMTVRFTTPEVEPVTDGPEPFRDSPIMICGEDRYQRLPFVPKPDFAASI